MKSRSTTSKKKAPAGYLRKKVRTSQCPICSLRVSSNRLGEHRRRLHSGEGKTKGETSRPRGPRNLPPKGLPLQQELSQRRYVECSACAANK